MRIFLGLLFAGSLFGFTHCAHLRTQVPDLPDQIGDGKQEGFAACGKIPPAKVVPNASEAIQEEARAQRDAVFSNCVREVDRTVWLYQPAIRVCSIFKEAVNLPLCIRTIANSYYGAGAINACETTQTDRGRISCFKTTKSAPPKNNNRPAVMLPS